MESVIILNLCNKKSWSYDVCLLRYGVLVDIIFLLFQAIFCFFAPLLTQKIKIWKKCKRTLDILSFYTCVPLIRIIWCMVPEIWSSTGRMFFWSYAIFCPFTPLKNENIKNEKNPWRYHQFTQLYQKSWSSVYCPRDMAHDGCNYFHFGLSCIFPSTFLQPLNGCQNSILNWVIKLNLMKLPLKFYSS